MLSDNLTWYRHQLFHLIRLLSGFSYTTLLLSSESQERCEDEFRPIVDGVISLEQVAPNYGKARRRLEVVKMRAMSYQSGYHDYRIDRGGVEVFPRLQLVEETASEHTDLLRTGVAELDFMLNGGLKTGTTCVFIGASGTGKSTLATLYARAAAQNGKRSAIFLFDEDEDSFLFRAKGLSMDLSAHIDRGLIRLRRISVGEISPGEFAQTIRKAVNEEDVKLLVIDSLTGYYIAMPEEKLLLAQMHELVGYLNKRGVLSLLLVAQHGFIEESLAEPRSTSMLADAVILLRYFEAKGASLIALSVPKKRYGPHDRSIREMEISSGGIKVGRPIEGFRGVLTGVPVYEGRNEELMKGDT